MRLDGVRWDGRNGTGVVFLQAFLGLGVGEMRSLFCAGRLLSVGSVCWGYRALWQEVCTVWWSTLSLGSW